jgi:hypothetical protein
VSVTFVLFDVRLWLWLGKGREILERFVGQGRVAVFETGWCWMMLEKQSGVMRGHLFTQCRLPVLCSLPQNLSIFLISPCVWYGIVTDLMVSFHIQLLQWVTEQFWPRQMFCMLDRRVQVLEIRFNMGWPSWVWALGHCYCGTDLLAHLECICSMSAGSTQGGRGYTALKVSSASPPAPLQWIQPGPPQEVDNVEIFIVRVSHCGSATQIATNIWLHLVVLVLHHRNPVVFIVRGP